MSLATDDLVLVAFELVPKIVEPVVKRPPGTIPVLVIDAADEVALVLMPFTDLVDEGVC